MVEKKFSCVQGCSDCCVYREYYPSKQFGKIGVLLLPGEVPEIEMRARENSLDVKILPRIAVGKDSPEKIIAYQMMGKTTTATSARSLTLILARIRPTGVLPAGYMRTGL